MNYTQLPDDDMTATKEQLIKLQEWRDEIGIPAQTKCEELQVIIDENSVEMEHLRQELQTATFELETYGEEMEKLKQDKQDLMEEITNLKKLTVDDDMVKKSLQEKDAEIELIQNQFEKSFAELMRSKESMAEMQRENNQLTEENQQYEIILDKLQREETSLKDKINKESAELRKLKQNYDELDLEYRSERSFGKHQSVLAQELQSEVNNLRDYQRSLDTIDSQDNIDNFTDHTNKNLGGGHAPAKTMRIGPSTLRLSAADSDAYIKLFGGDTPRDTPRDTPYGYAYDLYGDTPKGNRNSNKFYHFVQYDNTDHTNPISEDETQSNDDTKQAKDYGYGINEAILKEQLQTEFDDKLGKEKGRLIEKHKLEINELKKQCNEYKKQLIDKNEELREWKNGNGIKNGRNHHRGNPNNKPDLSKCKVFGWTAW